MNNVQVKYGGSYKKHYGHKRYYNSIQDYISVFHNIGVPAIEYYDGQRSWRFNGKAYRINGPASTPGNGHILHNIYLRINIGKLVI